MWYVTLTGDSSILGSLSTEKNSSIEKSSDEFILKLKEFDNYGDASDIKKIASEYIDLLNGIIFLQDGIRRFRSEFLLKSKYHFGKVMLDLRLIESNRDVSHLPKM